jgi:hypothetical protein
MSGGLASKEMLVLFLLPLSLLLYFKSTEALSVVARFAWLTLTGVILGFSALTQPSLLLFPSVLFAYEWIRRHSPFRSLARLTCVTCAMLLVIAPWTLRNHHIFKAWVPVSTNGGDVFYRANNDLATGAFTENSNPQFEQLDEVTRSRVGYRLGKEWIRQHPARFFMLALRKQVLFLGDDSQGAYESLKRGLGINGIQYLAWKSISNLYWLAIWFLVLTGLQTNWNRYVRSMPPEFSAVQLSILYLWGIHSVFESGGKYHLPLIGVLAVMATLPAYKEQVEP